MIKHIRQCFRTHLLQDLHSDEHKRFDDTSNACIHLLGIPKSKRKGTPSATNCSSALIFLGDCREHAIEMCAFFDFWQRYKINDMLKSAFKLINSSIDIQKQFDGIKSEIKEILSNQLRAGHVGIYSKVQMVDKYQHIGWDKGKHKLLRKYTLDSVKNKEKLTEYELQHSFIFAYFGNGKEDYFVIKPVWDDIKNKMQLPNEDGVPKIENLDMMISLELYNLVEEHTMTFLIKEIDEKIISFKCKDSFYNEKYNIPNGKPSEQSPYHFGEQELDIKELDYGGSMSVGSWNVWDEGSKNYILAPIRIKLLPFSKRTDTPAIQANPQKLRYLGLGLEYIDIVGELVREEYTHSTGGISRRDRFLDLLHSYSVQNPSS